MPGKPDADDWPVERGGQIQFQSSFLLSQAQPWWRELGENGSKSPSTTDQLNGSSVMNISTQSEVSEEHMVSPSVSGTGKDLSKEHQSIKHVLSSTPLTMGKEPSPNSQMELFSRPIVLTSNPYPDAQYGGILTAYGNQAMIHPQFYGMHARMPLPLEMEVEPVYVNAKQYHGILRRRQSRAKAELEKKVIKVRKPYLHESRHLHAMRRARGCGGRFVNTKKLEGNNNANAQQKDNNSGTAANLNLGSSNYHPDASESMVHDMQKVQSLSIEYHDGSYMSSLNHLQFNGQKEVDCLAQERKSMPMHGAPNGAIK